MIGFERSSYNVSEIDGFIDVAVVIINGELSRPVEVTVTAMEGTASGEWACCHYKRGWARVAEPEGLFL